MAPLAMAAAKLVGRLVDRRELIEEREDRLLL